MASIYLLFLFFSFLLFVAIKVFSLWLNRRNQEVIDTSEISIVVPFRNESETLPPFLESLFSQENLPEEIVFIDDHSTDDSASIVQKIIEENKKGQLLHLPKELKGKKEALNYGIQNATKPYVLTLDADVKLNEKYMNSLKKCTGKGLFSLPVIMEGRKFWSKLFSTEYLFFNAFNFLIGRIWPISVNGANLLFNQGVVNYQKQLERHKHIPSGDDYFLLKHFRENHLPIQISNDVNLSVKTDAPHSLKSYFDQRVRWLSKSKSQINWTDTLIGAFISLYFLGGIVALILAAFQGEWLILVSVFFLRFFLDVLVYLNYAQRLRATKYLLFLPFFQLIYPPLFIGVLILSLFYQPKWKER